MNLKVKKLTEFISNNNQFLDDSELWKSIMLAFPCSSARAKELATTHCNMLSFYALLYCQDLTQLNYSQFFKLLLDKKAIDEHGWFFWEKPDIFKLLEINVELIMTPFGVNYSEGFYQLKITNDHGDHFLACYCKDHTIFICDSGNRGIGVSLETGLKIGDHKEWLKEYKI